MALARLRLQRKRSICAKSVSHLGKPEHAFGGDCSFRPLNAYHCCSSIGLGKPVAQSCAIRVDKSLWLSSSTFADFGREMLHVLTVSPSTSIIMSPPGVTEM